MKLWIAFWNILKKDMRTYYLKPPNVSWGIIFPLAWTGMFFIKSGSGLGSIPELLPGVVAVSVLFGTTSMLAVTVTFEKKNRSFERLLLAPVPLELLMLAKTSGAILFGTANAFVPIVMAAFLTDLSGMVWGGVRPRCDPHRGGFDLPGAVHRGRGKRGVRGADLFQLLPFSDDVPVRALLSHRRPAGVPEAAVLRSAVDLRGRRAPRGRPRRPRNALLRGPVRARRILHRPVRP